ncbi:NUDIX hydrolase [Bdellovibrio bacteriovorus]|uniref:NUDIX domain-containing protein n=1 Tax=Bdellovibrio bacteriovorus TaxID=959 RepID=UPI0021D3D054|nr:NUDIX hydrolase [Bdellovibrio bacteriovorus]UXR66139.1 NUDIX hydrolase [Bdellovibrio bacteriovorus]
MYKDDKEYYASLPRKRIGVGALIFYKRMLLIVQPGYSSSWILPGGTVEYEESPLEALIREVQDELKLKIVPKNLIAVDYVANTDVKGEYLQLLFSTEDLTEEQAQSIEAKFYEVKNYRFLDFDDALSLLAPNIARRLQSLQNHPNEILYLENGKQNPIALLNL